MRWLAVLVVVAFCVLALTWCEFPNVPTSEDNSLYESFQSAVPETFKGARVLDEWRGFDFRWRVNSMTWQCAWRVYDLKGLPIAGFVREVEATQQSPAEQYVRSRYRMWLTRAYAMGDGAKNLELSRDKGAIKAEFPLFGNSDFCAAPGPAFERVLTDVRRAWRDGRAPFLYSIHCHRCGVLSSSLNHTINVWIVDLSEEKLYMLFMAEPNIW